jgi:hypothetical protein
MRIADSLKNSPGAAPVLIGFYLLSVFVLLTLAGKPFFYPMDDAYIHTATARTLATAGVWGVTPSAPAAASSSPLWTLLLAGAYLLSPASGFLYLPLAFNLIAGCALIALLASMFSARGPALAATAAILLAAALPSVSMLGMEHPLHMVCALALCLYGCRLIAGPEARDDARTLGLAALLAAAAVAARYESLFLAAPLAALAALRGRWRLAAAFAIGAAAPVLGFGLYWMHNGGWLLPNSLLLKTDVAGSASPLATALARYGKNLNRANVIGEFSLMLIAVATLALIHWRRFRQVWDLPILFACCALCSAMAQLAFASTGWLVRYEAWLIVLNMAALFLLAEQLLAPRAFILLAVLVAALFAVRVADAGMRTVMSVDDRRVQHLAPALFVAADYPSDAVIVNDLGAVAWFAPHSRPLDMFGLGNNEPLRLRFSPAGYDAAALRDWAHRAGARIAILEVCWSEISSRIPPDWPLVATWRIPRNVAFGEHMIAFFAVSPEEAGRLARDLAAFPSPDGVEVHMNPDRAHMKEECYDRPAG